jgi:transposase
MGTDIHLRAFTRKLGELHEFMLSANLMDQLPALQGVVSLIHEFMDLMHKKQATSVSSWLERVQKSESRELRWFARSLRREQAALEAAISLPWSNSPVEGIVNKIKLIKRQMYGRTSFETLRVHILTAFPPLHQL